MLSYVTSKNVKWCHLIWPTLYVLFAYVRIISFAIWFRFFVFLLVIVLFSFVIIRQVIG